MATSAAERVFALPELLESILIELGRTLQHQHFGLLPAIQLFLLQRVNSTFKITILLSTPLQEPMGLIIWLNWLLKQLDKHNPLLPSSSEIAPDIFHGRVERVMAQITVQEEEFGELCPRSRKDPDAPWLTMPLTYPSECGDRRRRSLVFISPPPGWHVECEFGEAATLGHVVRKSRNPRREAMDPPRQPIPMGLGTFNVAKYLCYLGRSKRARSTGRFYRELEPEQREGKGGYGVMTSSGR